MFIKRYQQFLYPLILCILTGIALISLLHHQQRKLAVVDAVRLFNEYKMKLDLEIIERGKLSAYEKQLDSIEASFKVVVNSDAEEARKLATKYQAMKGNMEQAYAAGNQTINEQVWKRLNPLVEQYGKEQKLHVIVGANGMGSVLYNDDYYDLTDDLINFVNDRYENDN